MIETEMKLTRERWEELSDDHRSLQPVAGILGAENWERRDLKLGYALRCTFATQEAADAARAKWDCSEYIDPEARRMAEEAAAAAASDAARPQTAFTLSIQRYLEFHHEALRLTKEHVERTGLEPEGGVLMYLIAKVVGATECRLDREDTFASRKHVTVVGYFRTDEEAVEAKLRWIDE